MILRSDFSQDAEIFVKSVCIKSGMSRTRKFARRGFFTKCGGCKCKWIFAYFSGFLDEFL